jgi:hypothetical protein
MHSKTPIKVIKKNDVRFYKTTTITKQSTKTNTRREIASTVSGWVNEFQLQGKGTKQSFDCLFAQN